MLGANGRQRAKQRYQAIRGQLIVLMITGASLQLERDTRC